MKSATKFNLNNICNRNYYYLLCSVENHELICTIKQLSLQGRIHKLKHCVNSRPKSVYKDQEAVKCLFSLHDTYVIVPANKASNNIVFVCKSYYFECLIKELGINSNTSSNTTYKSTSFDKDEILANHRSFMISLNIPSGKESEDLPYLYWIPKLHKTPYKERKKGT